MTRGIHNLGRKRSEGYKRRLRAGIERIQAEGKPFGRTRERLIEVGQCEICSRVFKWTQGGAKNVRHQKTGRFCSKRCLVKWLHQHRQKLPDAVTLQTLYEEHGLTTPEIAKRYGLLQPRSVGQALEKIGVKRRRSGPRNSGLCIEGGCDQPVYQIQHKGNGSWYGKRCHEHWLKHRAGLNKRYLQNNPAQREKRNEYMRGYHRKTRNTTQDERTASERVAV